MRLSTDRREAAAAWFAAQRRAVMSVEERAAFDDWRADPNLIKTLSYNQLFISAAEMQESFIKEFPGAEVFYVSKGKVSKN